MFRTCLLMQGAKYYHQVVNKWKYRIWLTRYHAWISYNTPQIDFLIPILELSVVTTYVYILVGFCYKVSIIAWNLPNTDYYVFSLYFVSFFTHSILEDIEKFFLARKWPLRKWSWCSNSMLSNPWKCCPIDNAQNSWNFDWCWILNNLIFNVKYFVVRIPF